MIDKLLRAPKEQILQPLARGALRNIHPTTVTLLACGVGLAAALAAGAGLMGLSLGLWLSNRALDGLDGTLARTQGRQSDFGGYLDIVLDHIVYAAIPFGLAYHLATPQAYLALAALLASFYINGASWMYLAALLEKRALGAKAQGELTTVTMPGGIVEGAETILFFSLFLLFPAFSAPLFWAMALLTLLGAGQRVLWAYRSL